jgi:hypothetical protein
VVIVMLIVMSNADMAAIMLDDDCDVDCDVIMTMMIIMQ